MKKINLLTTFLCLNIGITFAQDPQLTQFFSCPTLMNPAFAGSNACSKLSVTSRNQWVGVNTAYQTHVATYDHYFTNKNFGMGLILASDQAGTGVLKTNFASAAFSYEAVINRRSSFRFALQPGFGMRTVNFNKLYFGDQIVRGGGVATIETPTQKRYFFDLNAGFLYSVQNFWMGASFSHINRTNESMYTDDYQYMPLKYSFHMGSKILLNKDEKKESEQFYLLPVFYYKGQAEFDQADVGMYLNKGIMSFGIWYRGIPALKYYKKGYSNNDALAFIVGFSLKKFNVGYSYDLTISKLTNKTFGSHEVSLSYQFCTAAKKKQKRNTSAVYCPKF